MAAVDSSSLPPIARPRATWRLLLRALGAAIDPRALILAGLGCGAVKAGWDGLSIGLGKSPWIVSPRMIDPVGFDPSIEGASVLLRAVVAPVIGLLSPFVSLFRPDVSALVRVHAGLASLWVLIVWSLFGGAIARLAAVRVARSERIGIKSALEFSARRLGTLIAAPLAPLVIAYGIGLLGALIGLLNRIPGTIGQNVAVLLAFVPIFVGLVDAVILVGLALAWPLMVATVAAEGEDFFDAISRSYSYVNQRTGRYLGLSVVAGSIGSIGLVLFPAFISVGLGLADWSVSIGAPREVGFRFLPLQSPGIGEPTLPVVAAFWKQLIKMGLDGWIFSYFWSASMVVYLILRQDVDGAELHDVYEPSHESDELVPAEAAPSPSEPSTAQ